MISDLLKMASLVVEAEHAVVGGVHSPKGCHACILFHEFRAYVRELVAADPFKHVNIWGIGDGIRVTLLLSGDMKKRNYDFLLQHIELLRPEEPSAEPTILEEPQGAAPVPAPPKEPPAP